MPSKKDNHRHAVRRVRRALNSAELPPTQIGNSKLVRINYGAGPDKNRSIDSMFDPNIYDYDEDFYFGYECCDYCDFCPLHVDMYSGNGWTYEAANEVNTPKLSEIFVVALLAA